MLLGIGIAATVKAVGQTGHAFNVSWDYRHLFQHQKRHPSLKTLLWHSSYTPWMLFDSFSHPPFPSPSFASLPPILLTLSLPSHQPFLSILALFHTSSNVCSPLSPILTFCLTSHYILSPVQNESSIWNLFVYYLCSISSCCYFSRSKSIWYKNW